MLNLAAQLSQLPEVRRDGPWAGQEHVKGWAVFGLPFDSGHVLALRVMPESSLAPYRSLYHRDPEGRWRLAVDGPRVCACTRHYGYACDLTGYTRIGVEWTGPATVHVTVDQPRTDWTFTASSSPLLGLINAVNGAMPLSSWRSQVLLRARERAAKALRLGDLRLSGAAPSGSRETLMLERLYFIESSTASVDGVDLGRPTRLTASPMLGTMPLPARGVLAVGQAAWQIDDIQEFGRLRQELGDSVPVGAGYV